MRTDEGEEIIEPGDYDIDGTRLRVYLTEDEDEQVHMWACTHCQEVDGITSAILTNVIDGRMTIRQTESGEFQMSMTQAGIDQAKHLIENLTDREDDDDG